jgi:opacity protein-like surface antigen
MINKKLLAVVSIATTIISSSVFAKTEGHYVGVDLLNTRVSIDRSSSDRDNDYGVGVNYKHAFNYDGLFVAPGVFAEKNNTSVPGISNINIKNRYGFKADLGYDLDQNLSIYVTGGLALLNYRVNDSSESFAHRAKADYFTGAGISHKYSDTVTLNLEFNTQKFNLKSKTTSIADINVDMNTIKAGVSYNF